jgi:hypothetical protein
MGALLLSLTLLAGAQPPADESAPDAPPAAAPEAAQPAAEPTDRPQLIVMELKAIDVDEDRVELITGRIADVLGRERAFVTLTSTDLQQLMGVAAEKQALGCDVESCVAEIAAAYGARYVVYGRVAKVGDLVLMQLSLFDAEAARPINRREIEGATLRDVLDATAGGASDLVAPLTGDAPAPAPDGWSPGALFWVGSAVGVVGLVGAAALGGWSAYLFTQSQATGGVVAPNDKVRAAEQLPMFAIGAGAGAGVALLGAGLLVTDLVLE